MTIFKTRKAVNQLLKAVILLQKRMDRLEFAMDRLAEMQGKEWSEGEGLWRAIKKRKRNDKADTALGQ